MAAIQKFIQSRQTLNTDRISENLSRYTLRKQMSQVFVNPYSFKHSLKLPKGRTVRKQTSMCTAIESIQNPERPCIKPFQCANITTMNRDRYTKRISKYGQFNPLSSKSLDLKEKKIQSRTFEDIGVSSRNMKKVDYLVKHKPDPIIIGEVPTKKPLVKKPDSRRLRDNGNQAKQTFTWKVDMKVKKNFYSTYSSIATSSQTLEHKTNSFANVLNYSSRR